MNRVVRVSLLFLVILLAFLAGSYFLFGGAIKEQVQQRFMKYDVEGIVKDVSTDAALELVEVYVNGSPTFTNHEGKFYVGGLEEFPLVRLKQESAFESYKFAFACSETGRLGVLTQGVNCEANLVPTLETTIMRVAFSFVSPSKQSDLDIEHRYGYLWKIMHPDSRGEWGDYDNYVTTMIQREKILWDLDGNLIAVKPYSEPVMLESWTDPLTGKIYSNVAEVVFETTDFAGFRRYPKEHFVESGGFWHYFNTYNEEEVDDFIARYGE